MIIDVTPNGLIWARAYAAGACLRGWLGWRRWGPVGCPGGSEDVMGAEENKLLVRRLVEGINNGSLEVLDEVADAGFVRAAR